MDATQRAALAAAIRADNDPAVVAALAIRNDTELTRLYNLPSTYIVWRTDLQPAEYREAVVWTEVDALTVGKARIWEWITQQMTAPIDASKANVRTGLADCWASNTTSRANLLAAAKRAATKAEKLFATGTGTTAAPGVMGWEGQITTEDVGRGLNG